MTRISADRPSIAPTGVDRIRSPRRWRVGLMAVAMLVGWSGCGGGGALVSAAPAAVTSSIGNVGVSLMFDSWGSPMVATLAQQGDTPLSFDISTVATMAHDAGRLHVGAIEYYVGWGAAETASGTWDWRQYRADTQTIRSSGAQFVAYGWVQNLPTWVRNDAGYPRARDSGTGLDSDALSIFASQTRDAYDRFYGQLQTQLGSSIDVLRVGSPYDYGETAYPAGDAMAVFPSWNVVPGFWAGEDAARADFSQAMQAKYGTVANLNAAWNTGLATFTGLPYPVDATRRRYWLDYIEWYHSGFTRKMGELLDVVRVHFPTTPLLINLSKATEKIIYGQDLSGIVQMTADRGVRLRTPTGLYVSFIYGKRVATACRFYGQHYLSSEPADGNEPLASLARSLFEDLVNGVYWHFDYPANLDLAGPLFAQYRDLKPKVPTASRPRIDTAILFPTTAHRLDNWDAWRQDGYAGGYPQGLREFAEDIRDVLDYDVVDERLIGDGALASYKILIWPAGTTVEGTTLAAIRHWIDGGGVLLAKATSTITDVEQTHGAFADLPSLPRTGDMITVGAGRIFDAGGDLRKLDGFVLARGQMQGLNAAYPARITQLPVLDTASDGVYVSDYADGTLLFNSTAAAVTKQLPVAEGQYGGIPTASVSVDLPAYAMRWVVRTPGAVGMR